MDLSPGQTKEVYALGHNLAAWRGEITGKVFVSDAYCPHLGAHLAVGGVVKDDCIQCPFHHWSFDGHSGRVQNIPYSETELEADKSKLKGLTMWRVFEANGFIYVWYHKNGKEPTWFPEILDNVSSARYNGRSEFQVCCHINDMAENAADAAHFDTIHDSPALFKGRLGTAFTDSLSKVLRHKFSATWNPSQDLAKAHQTVSEMTHVMTLFGDKFQFFSVDIIVRQIGAGIVITDFLTPFGNCVMVMSVTPVAPMLQRVVHRFYSESSFFHPIAQLIMHIEAVQISRDIKIWNRKSFAYQPCLQRTAYQHSVAQIIV